MPSKRDETILDGPDLGEAMAGAPDGLRLPSGVCQSLGSGAVLQAVDTSKLTAQFVIVTNERNRHGNSHQITPTKRGQGLGTDAYQGNPVILFDHGVSGNPFPVAQSSAIKKTARRAVATANFPERLRDVYPGVQGSDDLLRNSAAVFAGIAEGLIRMASIGFLPEKAMVRKYDGEEELEAGVQSLDDWRGLHFTQTELMEWSIVPIGADRGAMRQSIERGKIHDVRIPPFMLAGFRQQIEADPEPVTVPSGIDLSGLESKIDRLVEQVQSLQGTTVRAVIDEEPEEPFAAAPQTQTIPKTQSLAERYLAATEPTREESIAQAVGAATNPLAEAMAGLETRVRHLTGAID